MTAATPAAAAEPCPCVICNRQGRNGIACSATPAAAAEPDIDAMVNRFLSWKLPKDFSPDCGISYKPIHGGSGATGTNLFTADQARAMLEHVIATPAAAAEVSEWTRPRLQLERFGYATSDAVRPSRMDDGYWTPWHIAQAAIDIAASTPLAEPASIRMALQMLYDETADYIRLNNLGGMDNQCMRMARAALATPAAAAEVSEIEVLGAVARGWCHPANSGKVMDADLAKAIAHEVLALRTAGGKP